MRVRRAGTVLGALTALVLLGGPSWAETPSPEPTTVVSDGDPDCHYLPAPTGTPSEEATAEPTVDVTEAPPEEPTDVATGAPGDEPTDVPTDEPTDVPTDEPTDVPTDEPTDVPTDEPTDLPTDDPGAGSGGSWVCLAESQGVGDPTLGSGTVDVPQLPFSGAPVGVLVTLGAGLVAAGGAALVAGRRRLS